jgi:lysophospholipase L1-like esterase
MIGYIDSYMIPHEPSGSISTQQPLSQYRDGFDWEKRHEEVIQNTIKTKPQVILFGNSIINYWGGEPLPEKTEQRGAAAWRRYMSPEKVQNAGFGNDRIENVLWRVYHGELDNFTGNSVIVNIGTNNLAVNTDQEIVEGLSFLIKQIQLRKPAADIFVRGILPRKNRLDRIAELNKKIATMVQSNGCKYFDFSESFMLGKELNSTLFMADDLHLNEKGYDVFGRLFKELIRRKY